MSNNNADREVILSISHVDISFDVGGKKKFVAVKDANFDIYKGETFALVGESGSGKTTLGRAIMRILPTSGGEVFYKGQKINGKISHALDKQVIKEIQMIFQDPQSSLNERAKVSYIVGEGLMNVRPRRSTSAPPSSTASPRACTTSTFIRTRKSVLPRSIRRSRTSACCPSTSPVIRTSSPADSVSASALPAR